MASIDVKSKEMVGDRWRVVVDVDGKERVFLVADDSDLDNQVLLAVAAPLRVVTLGAREVKAPTPTPPTQAEIDKAAFIALCQDHAAKKAQVDAAIGKATQADVDAAYVTVKAAYKDEYASIMPRFF